MTVPGRRAPQADDAGFTLIEVLVAMFVFALVAMGLLTSVTKALSITNDNRSRVVAANLAESEVGAVRALPYDQVVTVADRTVQVGPVTYTVSRSVASHLASGTGNACAGGGTSREDYKKVSVKVSFRAMAGTKPIQADTIVRAPETTVDPATGAIGASVIDRDGQPVPGVSVTVAAVSGLTDDSGCVYLPGLAPGNLTMTATRSGYVTPAGSGTSSTTVGVTAGIITSTQVQLDAATTVAVQVAVLDATGTPLPGYGFPKTSSTSGVVPILDNPDRTVVTRTTLTGPATSANGTWTTSAFPYVNGYEAHLGACGTGVPVATARGATANVTLGLAALDLMVVPQAPSILVVKPGRRIQAVRSGPCSETYTSQAVTAADGSLKLGLPYGTWSLSVVGDLATPTVVTVAPGTNATAVNVGALL